MKSYVHVILLKEKQIQQRILKMLILSGTQSSGENFFKLLQDTTNLNVSLKNNNFIKSAAQYFVILVHHAKYKSSHPKNQSVTTNIKNLVSEKLYTRSRHEK